MCGIYGFTGGPQPGLAAAMEAALRHRGPDDAGSFAAADLSIGATRLAIIGRADGAQPLFNEDRSLVLVCNGEIYNHRALRRELERRGHRMMTGSDAEVALHLYEDEGEAMLGRLEGMFALALWDARRRRLLLARDPMGMKPLVYATHEGRLLFASEAKALFLAAELPRQVDAAALEALVGLGLVPGERTLFSGVRRLPAGCSLTLAAGAHGEPWRVGDPSPFRPPYPAQRRGPRGAAAATALRAALEAAVASHLESEVPLGAALSGGLDSSVVVALAARLLGRSFPTYTIGFPGDQDERSWARRVAEHCGTDHHELTASGEELLARLPATLWHVEEPRNGPMAPGDLLFERVRRDGVEVVLLGEGSDELFGGYHRLKTALPPFGWLPATAGRRLYLASRGGDGERRRTIGPALREAAAASLVDATLDPVFARRGRRRLEALLRLEQEVRLPATHLMRVDRLSMAHGVEARLPYLDPAVVALARSMPLAATLDWRGGKRALREVADSLLPAAVRRRPKQGQRDPLRRLLGGGMLEIAGELLGEAVVQGRGCFDPGHVRRLLDRVRRGRGGPFAPLRLNLLVLVEMWHRVFIDPPRLQPPAGVLPPPTAPEALAATLGRVATP